MGDKNYQHENVFYCICLVVYHIVKMEKKPKGKRKGEPPTFDFYKVPKAYVLMSRHPFFTMHVGVLNQIMMIYKYEQLENSKLATYQNFQKSLESIDISFSTQVNTDVQSATSMLDVVPLVS